MRVVVFMLLLANLGFFGWSYWQGAQAEDAPPPAAVAPLQLATARTTPATHCQSLGPLTDSTQMLSVHFRVASQGSTAVQFAPNTSS